MRNAEITHEFTRSIPLPLIQAAREWVRDCEWGDLKPRHVWQLTRPALVRGVNRHYDGGWEAFVADHTPAPQDEHYPLWESKGWLEQHSILAANMHDVDADLQDELYDAM